jgi:undecaprenyl-phosphate 4-deoxy-4-formamido-L-arabinose transferase
MTGDHLEERGQDRQHLVSVVVPVYRGEHHLADLVAELEPYTKSSLSPAGRPFRVTEVLLVHDCGPDRSPEVMRDLAARYDFVRTIWLSRNFGQHAATLAGMASAGGEWIATLDEDGQHDPGYLGDLLDVAVDAGARVVYAQPTNAPPHSAFRNLTSRTAKRLVRLLSGGADASAFQSYRLVLGEVGRSVAAYAGAGVYLDIALSWVAGAPATAPVRLRQEGERRSGYSTRTLLSHFWRMVLSGGTRGLRLVSGLGVAFAILGFVYALFLVVNRLTDDTLIQGWTSLVVVVLVCTGVILFSLGIIAEYVGVAVNMAMGKPLYLITSDPADGPLGRRDPPR